ncbi:MAG TPA: glutamate-1-semialdehyde 2,1-aminomutase [Candidatus Omnitrophota bacterium]|nr:glutamate-1-semialdehyde 2,1-aminomutase [Candidatus Omnitrophota bacterium]
MRQAWRKAQKNLVGGVNSPVRAFKSVGGDPIFFEQALGPNLYDIEGRRYLDFCMSWGAILLGHADEGTVSAIQRQAQKGTSFGAATTLETALACEIKKAFPKMEKIRFTSSGTEAVMGAVRLARGITGKSRIVKFEGCYHGHSDSMLVKAGSGLATLGTPDSAGIPPALAELTSVLPYNDIEAVNAFFGGRKDIACVIVEPIAGNMGVIPAKTGFLKALRQKTKECGALLIFDEVISGFRVGYGGAQHIYRIEPDLTVLGKIIGGGLPVGAFGGRSGLMEKLAPLGPVYQAGTLSGNPLSMAAGLSVLSRLGPGFYEDLNDKTKKFTEEAESVLRSRGLKVSVSSAGSMFTIFFLGRAPVNFKDASSQDMPAFRRFFHQALNSGIYTPPSAYEASFISAAHKETELQKTLEVYKTC